ncbi:MULTISPECIES: hypothetical protein [unclassified Kaistella]|uniref:hypothetical protein n=1 Tax=unclassified Kaistella TaxID=2762626 RepID=UPI002735F8F6|nr:MULTISPECIES: hypothetical protein [unclassified Kaistella]MDP2454177.1 hypothetical protein [Kaistella sp. SH11-4b]MDP2457752.1 hypothetical protein [Kaistella sp. SH40-3]MDP2460510.1 hypothetical protein [Kaistella sp. SH19-2b]
MKNIVFWLRFSVFNFFLVAVLGVLMRYKIAYSLPIVDQKHVQEAHSHFAFYGWITQIIYVLMIRYLHGFLTEQQLKKYHTLLIVNAVSAFAMIPSFIYNGYYWASIAASTAALLTSFVFFFFLLNDLKGKKDLSKPWFIGGLFFSVISSVGVFGLSYMMSSGNMTQNLYLASTYYYLHFQYNGFFIFSCIGFLIHSLKEIGSEISEKENKMIFWLMFVGCVIGFGLSILWMKLPMWIFVVIIFGSIAQTIGAVKIYLMVKRNWAKLVLNFSALQRFVLMYVGFAFFVKILLQLGSNVPVLSQFAFGFRNVVIAYLHLILLMCVSAFLINQILAVNVFKMTKPVVNGLRLLLLGIFLNEAVLGLMGVFSIKYISIPFTPEILLAVSLLMMISLLVIFLSLKKKA